MSSRPVLRKQTLNGILSTGNLQRMDNEQNKNSADVKIFKCIPSFHLSSKDGENQVPTECAQKPLLHHGKSRIPVLAKTLHLQTSEFNQCYTKWEEKHLVRKAKTKRQSTQPVLFNNHRNKKQKAAEIHKPLTASHSKTHAVQSNRSACNAKPSNSQILLDSKGNSVRGVDQCLGKTAENVSQLSGQSRPSKPLKTSATLNKPLSSFSGKMLQNECNSAQFVPGAEDTLDNMSLLSLKEPSKSSHAELLTLQDHSSKALNDKEQNIQLDHTALLRVLKNEGVTPRSKPYQNLPQRMSVKKSQQKAGPPAGPARMVHFSPDSRALQSILQNEGVKAGGPLGATFIDSVCASNRGTSIYIAQRMPIKKRNTEATGGPVALRQTPLVKPTPQRICNTKHQLTSMKGCQTPYSALGPRRCNINIHSCQEKVVQRLFDDPEDEQSTAGPDKDPETQSKQLPVQTSSSSSSKEPVDACRTKEEKTSVPAQPRESVIVFSTSKKLLRASQLDLNISAQQDQLGPASSNQRNWSEAQSETSAESEPARHSNPSVLPRHRDPTTKKTSSLSSAVLMLRKRFPPLEELLLDDEVSTYTSKSVTTAPGFLHQWPRCENPLASTLHFEESTKFVPIDCSSSGFAQPSAAEKMTCITFMR